MSDELLGRGLERAIGLQRQFNELENITYRQMLLSRSEDPFERIRQITQAQAEFCKQVDKLLATKESE